MAESKSDLHPQTFVIVRGNYYKVKDAYLVCKKMVLSKIKPFDLPLVLFATYYVFNIQYCSGCTNFFSFLEVPFLNATPPPPPPKKKEKKS